MKARRGIVLPGWREDVEKSFRLAMETAGIKKGGTGPLVGIEVVTGIPETLGLKTFSAILADNGQELNSLHVAVVYTDKPDLKAATDMVKKYSSLTLEAGGKYLVCSWVNTVRALVPDDFKTARSFYEEQGQKMPGGLKLLYHNHAAEFLPETNGAFADEFSKVSGKEFALAADIGWTAWAGFDVRILADKCGHLMRYMHLRDFIGKDFTALGKGNNPIAGQIRHIMTKTEIDWISAELPISDVTWTGKTDEDIISFSRQGLDNLGRELPNLV
jgi:sugar phosphate isomerase/epimerase